MKLGQGRDNSKQFFKDNPDIAAEIEAKVRENVDALYDKTPKKPAAVTAVEVPTSLMQEEAPSRSAKAEIDIIVDD